MNLTKLKLQQSLSGSKSDFMLSVCLNNGSLNLDSMEQDGVLFDRGP